MEYLIIILIGTAIIWLTYFFIRRSEIKKEEVKENVPYIKSPPITPVENKTSHHQVTEDMLYAEKNDMWICPHCETINSKASEKCCACGFKNRRKDQHYVL